MHTIPENTEMSIPPKYNSPENESQSENAKCSCDSIIRCKWSGENAHKWIATIAGVITVISGIVATLVIFVGGNGDKSSSEAENILQNLANAVSSPSSPNSLCQCPNGVGSLTCENKTVYNCISCDLGYNLVQNSNNTKICIESCKQNEVLNQETNSCESKECICSNGVPVPISLCEIPGSEDCDH